MSIHTSNDSFLGYLHTFRGFAIINIVFIHCVVAAFLAVDQMDVHPIPIWNELLFHDSTLYFSFISGLLFTAILQKRGYNKFYLSKARNVILPYAFLTLLITVLKFLTPEQSGIEASIPNFLGH